MKILFILSLLIASSLTFGQAASSGNTTTRYPKGPLYETDQTHDEVHKEHRQEEVDYKKRVEQGQGTVPGEKVQDDAKDNELGGDNSTVPGNP